MIRLGALLAAALVVLSGCGGDDGDPTPETFDEPSSYRITYEVTDAEGDVTTEEVGVRRPFVAESVTGPDVYSRTALGRLLLPEGVLAIGPAMGGVDLRLAPVLDDALERGLLEEGDAKEVAGRPCRVYRAGSSVIAGELVTGGPTSTSYADACFDEAGLLLEERWVSDGDVLRTKVATAVSIGGEDDLGAAWADEPTSLPGGGGSFTAIDDEVATAEVPDGFELVGRFRTELPAIAGARTSTAVVWTRGIDLLVVELGPPPTGGDQLEPLLVGLRGVEVREVLDDGRLLRVLGTLSVDEVQAFASTVELSR